MEEAPVAVVIIHDGRLELPHPDGWTTSLDAAGSVRVVGDFRRFLRTMPPSPKQLK